MVFSDIPWKKKKYTSRLFALLVHFFDGFQPQKTLQMWEFPHLEKILEVGVCRGEPKKLTTVRAAGSYPNVFFKNHSDLGTFFKRLKQLRYHLPSLKVT